jgi:hypothetical protein
MNKEPAHAVDLLNIGGSSIEFSIRVVFGPPKKKSCKPSWYMKQRVEQIIFENRV